MRRALAASPAVASVQAAARIRGRVRAAPAATAERPGAPSDGPTPEILHQRLAALAGRSVADAALAGAWRLADVDGIVTSVDQAAGYGGRWFDVQEYASRQKLSSAEAIHRANECSLAQEAALADARLRGGKLGRVSCAHIPGAEGPINPAPPALPSPR